MFANERNNDENKQKYEAVQKKNSFFCNTVGNKKQLEKEDNDVLDFCDKNDSDELKWAGGNSPKKFKNDREELSIRAQRSHYF